MVSIHPPSAAPVRDEGPIVVVTPPSRVTDDSIATVLRALERCLSRGSPYALIFDLSKAGTPNPVQRATLAGHMRKNKPLIARWVRGIAVVAPSQLLRGVLTAIFWIEPPPVTHQIFATMGEARNWASELSASRADS